MRIALLFLAAALAAAGGPVAAQSAESDLGRNIAASCANCHGTNGVSGGVTASLAGQSKQDLVARMREFRSGARAGTIMPQLAKGYTDEQIELAAAWFATQPQTK